MSDTTLQALPAAGRISEGYQRYLRSLIPISHEGIRGALHSELTTDHLVRGPFLEATPAYRRGPSLRQMVDEGAVPPSLLDVCGPALPADRPLYSHQEQSLRRARAGRNLVVATGTGSGKTESFLLPILAHLAEEHEAGRLGAGVRALLLYPMNALANDQVHRLRSLLAEVPWITFGRYTGETKETADEALEDYVARHGAGPIRNELLSREQMRTSPPHLLLTNYAMLEYLLLRPEDLELFDAHRDTWRFIVVDEAHVYDGARGTEVGMLLRRLRDRVASASLQAIATSATVGAGDDAGKVLGFASNLFDLPFGSDATGSDLVVATRVEPPASTWALPDSMTFRQLAAAPRDRVDDAGADAPGDEGYDEWLDDLGPTDPEPAESSLETLIRTAAGAGSSTDVPGLLAAEEHVGRLRRSLSKGPREVAGVASEVFGSSEGAVGELAALVDLAAGVRHADGSPVVSARYHLWINSADGGFVCLDPNGPHGYLREHRHCPRCAESGTADVPVFQFAACQRCSAGYLGAHRSDLNGRYIWFVLGHHTNPDDEDEADESPAEPGAGPGHLWLCPRCGATADDGSACPGCAVDRIAVSTVSDSHADPEGARRPPRRCQACGGRTATLIRGLSAGPEASTSVIATSLYQEIPDELAEIPGGGRKLLAFSDSRQQAAYFAPYLERGFRRLLWRRVLLEAIEGTSRDAGGPVAFPDVLARALRLSDRYGLHADAASGEERRRETASWLLAELCSTDERNSLEGAGQVVITLDGSSLAVPKPLRDAGFDDTEFHTLVTELLTTVRRAGALQLPDDLDVDPGHDAFGFRRADWAFRGTDPNQKRHIACWLPQQRTNKRLDYLRRVFQARGGPLDPQEALKALWVILTRPKVLLVDSTERGATVHRHALAPIRFSPAGPGFRCDACGRRAATHVSGVCPTTGCAGTMRPADPIDPAVDDNHYRWLHQHLQPTTLVAKEHTAQWDHDMAARIQKDFIDGLVNVLSSSTTFELGVDVGELQTVLLRNVPPTTANYLQRVGRAGRRGAAAALAVTFARSRPHDQAMFREPIDMIAGAMRAPFVPMDNTRIARRHVHSVVMSDFFRSMWTTRGLRWRTMAEFFDPEFGESGPQLLAQYLDPVPADLPAAIARILPPAVRADIDPVSPDWARRLVDQVRGVAEEFAAECGMLEDAIGEAIDRDSPSYNVHRAGALERTLKTIRSRRLLSVLARKNVLPKYGFPVDVVELRTSHLDSIGKNLELDRDLAIAISEYAPGSQIVAGGRVVRSAGLAVAPGRAWQTYRFGECRGKLRHFVMEAEPKPFPESCPQCGEAIAGMRAIRPEFGFVADKASERIRDEMPSSSPSEPAKVLRLSSHPWAATVHGAAGDVHLEWGKRAELAVTSQTRKRTGWWICPTCGRGELPTFTSRSAPRPPRAHTNPVTSRDCRGHMMMARLVHTFETDAVSITLPRLEVAAAESVLAALLAGASEFLEVPIDDIGGTIFSHGPIQQLVIYDTVPAGAGNAIRVAQQFDRVVERAVRRVSECLCGEDSSCYACLRHYRNQSVHEELSRAVARDVLGALGLQGPVQGSPVAPEVPTEGIDLSTVDAWVSYPHSLRDEVLSLVGVLEAHGIRVWVDRERLHVGDRWVRRLNALIARKTPAVLMVPPGGPTGFQNREAESLTAAGVPVFPVLLQGAAHRDVPALLLRQHVPATDPEGLWAQQIAAALRAGPPR